MRIHHLLIGLMIILLAVRLPYNIYTDLPYWVQQGAYAEYYGKLSKTVNIDNTTYLLNISLFMEMKIEAYGDYVHVYEFENATTVVSSPEHETILANSTTSEARFKINPETAATENQTYCTFFISKKLMVGDAISLACSTGEVMSGSIIDETYVDTYVNSWQNRRSLIVQVVTDDANYRFYYDTKARILLGIDIVFKNITSEQLTLKVRLSKTNVQPPSILVELFLLFENPFYVAIFAVIIFIVVLVIIARRASSKQYTKAGTIRVMPGVERLR